ncbi:MAG: hypothetical protein U0524_02975 [Candidatus Saccharimonadales bacterium]
MEAISLDTITDTMIAFGAPKANFEKRLTGLQSRYREPWRKYHVMEHPQEMFGELLQHIDQVRNPLTIGEAILYHDCVYDPAAPGNRNEQLSSWIGQDELEPIYGYSTAAKVGYYTTATAKHTANIDVSDRDLAFFLDTDLAILGADEERYNRYSNAIAEEYKDVVPPNVYATRRSLVLQKLSTRVSDIGVYTTELFRAKYEYQAQENIAREIDLLKQRPVA